MTMNKVALASLAAAFLVSGISAGSAQSMYRKKVKYRPLTVSGRMAPAPAAAPGEALGTALASPLTAIGGVGGPVGVAGAIGAGAVTGATSLVFAPFSGLTGGTVGISPVAAPPLPIVARYANTGKVTTSYDEGYSQPVPVDASGPIYKINYKESGERTVTPFSLLAFPITAATYAITAPLR